MAVIFCFSARTADESAEDSLRAGMLVGQIFIPDFEDWSEAERQEFAAAADYPVRKSAHASEYAVLGILWILALRAWGAAHGAVFRYAWLFSTIYAATDEFHQLFVPGRAGQPLDVLIDSGGALLGILAAWAVASIAGRLKDLKNFS